MVAVPNTLTRLSHALSIRAGGRAIGAIHTWSLSQRRAIDDEYEVEANSHGLPVDQVPGILEGREIRVARYDLYRGIMEEVFGAFEIVLLTDQFRPFTLREAWRGPGGGGGVTAARIARGGGASPAVVARVAGTVNGILGMPTPHYGYSGCWFVDVGRTIDATGDRVVNVDATLRFKRRYRVI